MWAELATTPLGMDGIKQDHSFFQHGDGLGLLYSGGYGNGFTSYLLRWIAFSAGTDFEIPAHWTEVTHSAQEDFSLAALDPLHGTILGPWTHGLPWPEGFMTRDCVLTWAFLVALCRLCAGWSGMDAGRK